MSEHETLSLITINFTICLYTLLINIEKQILLGKCTQLNYNLIFTNMHTTYLKANYILERQLLKFCMT